MQKMSYEISEREKKILSHELKKTSEHQIDIHINSDLEESFKSIESKLTSFLRAFFAKDNITIKAHITYPKIPSTNAQLEEIKADYPIVETIIKAWGLQV